MTLSEEFDKRGISYRLGAICLLRSENEQGKKVYCYLKIYGEMLEAFASFLKYDGGSYNPGQFGEVLAYGFGEPDDDTKRMMQDKYGYDASQELMLITPEMIANAQKQGE